MYSSQQGDEGVSIQVRSLASRDFWHNTFARWQSLLYVSIQVRSLASRDLLVRNFILLLSWSRFHSGEIPSE